MKQKRIKLISPRAKKQYGYYVTVKVYDTKELMQAAAEKDGYAKRDFLGLCQRYEKYSVEGRKKVYKDDLGIVYLCREHLTPAIIAHELGHAVLGVNMFKKKNSYPVVFKSMADEEDFLLNQTHAIEQFNLWWAGVQRVS